jgi:hypothetical protein
LPKVYSKKQATLKKCAQIPNESSGNRGDFGKRAEGSPPSGTATFDGGKMCTPSSKKKELAQMGDLRGNLYLFIFSSPLAFEARRKLISCCWKVFSN